MGVRFYKEFQLATNPLVVNCSMPASPTSSSHKPARALYDHSIKPLRLLRLMPVKLRSRSLARVLSSLRASHINFDLAWSAS